MSSDGDCGEETFFDAVMVFKLDRFHRNVI